MFGNGFYIKERFFFDFGYYLNDVFWVIEVICNYEDSWFYGEVNVR